MKKHFLTILIFFALINIFAENINFSADSMTGNASSKNDSTSLIGNAFVQTSTMEIKADKIELSGENFRFITAEGKVFGKNTSSQLDFTCGKMTYDRNTKIASLEDSVSLKDVTNDVTADAQIIEYNQDTETAIMQINIQIKQKDNTCTSAFAIYRKSEQMLELTGNPKIIQGGDSFQAQEIILNLKSQEITLDGRVRGTVTDTKKEVEQVVEQPSEQEETKEENPQDKVELEESESLPLQEDQVQNEEN